VIVFDERDAHGSTWQRYRGRGNECRAMPCSQYIPVLHSDLRQCHVPVERCEGVSTDAARTLNALLVGQRSVARNHDQL